MIFTESNFLTDDLFEIISLKSERLYKMSKLEDTAMEVVRDDIDPDRGIYDKNVSHQRAMRFRFYCNGDDVMQETIDFFGPDVGKTLLQVKYYMIDKGWENIKLSNVWFQYGDSETQMHRHSDGNTGIMQKLGAAEKDCFTSMIFTHPKWDNDWGGIFNIESMDGTETTIQNPDPNSLVIWNRHHPHWMTPIVKDCPMRMFIGMSWYEK